MLDKRTPIAQLVLDHSELAAVLQRHRIDYCCKGEQPLEDACRARGLEPGTVADELAHAISARVTPPESDPRKLSTQELVTQIVRRHHKYLRDALPFLIPLAKKVARVHGGHDPKLLDVRDDVEELSETLLPHLDHEENVVFPVLLAPFGHEAQLAAERVSLMGDHTDVALLLERIRNASHDYVSPDWACTSYRTLMKELEVLEADVFQHVHLENHVLMPRFAVQK